MTPRMRRVAGLGVGLLALGGSAAVPFVVGDGVVIGQLTEVILDIIAIIGLNVAAGYTGLLTIGAGALVGLGAFSAAALNVNMGLPMVAAVAGGTVIATVLGLVLLAPALRLGRTAYAMVSLYAAYNFVAAARLPQLQNITHSTTSFNHIQALFPLSAVNGDSFAQAEYGYWTVLAVAVVVLLLSWRLVASHWGRAFLSVRDDDVAAAALGVSPTRARLLALFVCALCAALAGALYAPTSQSCVETCSLSADRFSLNLSIFLFSALVVGGRANVAGPVVGGLAVGFFYVLLAGQDTGSGVWGQLLSGGAVYGVLLIVAATVLPGGICRLVSRLIPARTQTMTDSDESRASFAPIAAGPATVLAATDVSVRFGGAVALDAVSMQCARGSVHALIGANGSGKTTLLNVISGLVHPQGGSIELAGRRIATMAPHRRARAGIARTFQMPRIAAELSVVDNVIMGGFGRYRSGLVGLYLMPWRHRREERELRAQAHHLLRAVGLHRRAEEPAGVLTHGERRLLEVVRGMLAEPKLLLLDEPAAGLAADELTELASVILAARNAGCAVVLVEHNLAFVRRVASTATALDRGKVLADGPVADVLARHDVITCFVGERVA